MAEYFSDERYLQKAVELAESCPESVTSINDAFSVLVKDVPFNRLDNLIGRVKKDYPDMNESDIYSLLQGTADIDLNEPVDFLHYAYDILDNGVPIGSEVVEGTSTNTSGWIGHSLFEAEVCGILARASGLDVVKAVNLGMLHDIGRKFTHKFGHVVRGFEYLTDLGMDAESIGCLTHSFVNGGRCASNECAEPGFHVSDDGIPYWDEDAPKDDITLFLEKYSYTPYDLILNLADLMATSWEIVPPFERIKDIATRRTLDPTNRGYFLAEVINLCNHWLGETTTVRFTKDCTIDQMEEKLSLVSDKFWELFQTMESQFSSSN